VQPGHRLAAAIAQGDDEDQSRPRSVGRGGKGGQRLQVPAPGARSPRLRGAASPQDVETLRKEVALQKRAREEAEERTLQLEDDMIHWQRKAQEMEAELQASGNRSVVDWAAISQRRGEIDWTTYGINEELEGDHVDDQVRIDHLMLTSDQLRSHCQNLEVENASMKDLMQAFEIGLEQHASMIGHVNHKQKIRYTMQLKDTINRLLDELRRGRTRIFQLELGKNLIDDPLEAGTKQWDRSTRSVQATTCTTTTTRLTMRMDKENILQENSRRKSVA